MLVTRSQSLLFRLRILLAACLLLSIAGLLVKNDQLRDTELRATQLLRQTAPLTEMAGRITALIERLNAYSQFVATASTDTELDEAERRLKGINALHSDSFLSQKDLRELASLIALQRDIISSRQDIQIRLWVESQRLDDISWVLSSEQAALLGANERMQIDPSNAKINMDFAFELAGITTSIAQAALAVRDLQNADWTDVMRIKPALLGEINVIATHLARVAPSDTRAKLAYTLFDIKQSMFEADGIFAAFSELNRLVEQASAQHAGVEAIVSELTTRASLSQRKAVAEFQALALENQAITRNTRRLDLAITLLVGLGGILVFWALIEGKLFARIERLLYHVRAISSGSVSNPVTPLADDEIGELEAAVEGARQVQREMRTLHAKMAAILKNAPCGIATINAAGRIEMANDALGEMLSSSTIDLQDRNIFDLLASSPEDVGVMLPEATGSVYRCEHHISQNDGELIIDIAIRQVERAEDALFIATFVDISKRIAAQRALQNAYAEVRRHREDLERSNTDLDQFAYSASHDLKAPLRVIRNGLYWIEEDLGEKIDAETRTNLDLVKGRASRMERLLDDLLAYSRIGRTEDRIVKVTGEELIEEVVGLCDVPAGFTIEVGETLAALTFDMMPLKNILLNLVSNGIKHHDGEHGTIRVTVESTAGNMDIFEVSDDGPGIPVEFHERITQVFTTLKPRDQVEGSGMGLAFVKRQVEVKGGTLEILSGEGRGATFRFAWPRPLNSLSTLSAAATADVSDHLAQVVPLVQRH